MPLTGLEPTMAIALAATVVKRKAMTATTRRAITEVEEYEHQGQSDEQTDDYDLHGQVSLCAGLLSFGAGLLAAELLAGQAESGLDDAGRLDDADDAGCGDAADADVAGVVGKDLLRRHRAYSGGQA